MAGDDFAGLLRELKERSGLSYGALGKRLHMSASTLHRYVSGEVVPVEFAPVERLARACRATPAELLELHRRWIRADALRGVKKPGEGGSGAVTETPPAKAETPAEAEAEAGAEAEAVTSGVSEDAGVAGVQDAPDVPEAPAATAVPEAPVPPGPHGVPDIPDVPDVRTLSGAASAPVPATPRRRIPRPALYAASGVVAVSAAVALVANLVSGTGDDGRHGPAAAVAATSAAVSEPAGRPSASRSGSPSRSAASPSASASPTPSASAPSASAPATARSGAAASPSRGAAPADGPLLTVSTTPYYWDVPCEHAFLVDRSPKNVPPAPTQPDAVGWATALGAVSANRQMAVLTVQGTGAETVVLKGLHVRVVKSGPPLTWKQFVMGNGCGGQVDTGSFDVSLDLGDPLVMPVSGQRDFPYKVSESDPEVFYVNAHTSGHDVSWYLELEWSSGDRHGIMRVDDHGKPFRTSASQDNTYYARPLGSDGWEYVDPGPAE